MLPRNMTEGTFGESILLSSVKHLWVPHLLHTTHLEAGVKSYRRSRQTAVRYSVGPDRETGRRRRLESQGP